MNIRHVVNEDQDALYALFDDVSEDEGGPLSENTKKNFSRPSNAIVAEKDGKVMGVVHYKPRGDLLIIGLYVHPDHRNEGAGLELVREVARFAVERGFTGIRSSISNEYGRRAADAVAEVTGWSVAYEEEDDFVRATVSV